MNLVCGTLIGTVGITVYNHRIANNVKKAEELSAQLRCLYGPLFFHLKEFKAMSLEVVNLRTKNVGSDEVRYIVRKTHDDCLRSLVKTNAAMLQVVQHNCHYLDVDDVEMFSEFAAAHTELAVAFDSGLLCYPKSTVDTLGGDNRSIGPFHERIEEKFFQKKKQLAKLNK